MKVKQPLMYIGPGRRSDKTVIEWPLELTSEEQQAFRLAAADGPQKLRARLEQLCGKAAGVFSRDRFAPETNTGDAPGSVARWVAEMAVAMQQAAGHRVAFSAVVNGRVAECCRLIYEYEHLDTGIEAGELAMRLLSESIPGLEWTPDPALPGADLEDAWVQFLARAAEKVLPVDAQAIIDAAARLDVPCVKLEREPYGGLAGEFRIRPNGLLKLGHSCYQHIVDGTLCIDRNPALVPILFDRENLYRCMCELGLPAPRQDMEFRNLITAKRAIRAAERIGYPVVLKPCARSRFKALSPVQIFAPLGSAQEVRAAFEQVHESSQRVIVERYVAGSTFHLLLANHEPVCVAIPGGSPMLPSELHASMVSNAVRVSRTLDVGMLAVTFVTPDPGLALDDAGGAVVDLDPAPRLDRLLPDDAALMAKAAEGFVRWLFPPGAPSRIPLVAVTGTNGKTTTSRMITRIMRTAGFRPGMASTSGIYFNEKLHQPGDQAGSEGHHVVLESRDIDMGVLETARGAVANSGFMFDWCDVAVCLNVTEDHIGEFGVETLQQLTELKRSVLERARHAVVLNADYSTCRGMLPFAAGVAVYWTSVESSEIAISDLAGGPSFACVVEGQDDQAWLVLHEPGGIRSPVMPVAEIPATFNGMARFNISNAQHAICACHALGVRLDTIRKGLATFEASFENTPGRLNIYRGLPFTVIMDFAHNPDGMAQLCAFTDRMDVPGRRILLLDAGFQFNRLKMQLLDADQAIPWEITEFVNAAVGHFDHFVCHVDPEIHHSNPAKVLNLVRTALLQAGVTEREITIVAEREEGAIQALHLGRSGDLVVLILATDDVDKMWQRILSYRPEFLN